MIHSELQSAIQRAAELIAEADSLIIAAGAGMGVDSGLPDFRGREGFWQAYPALAEANIDFKSIANPIAFQRHIDRAWGFYGHRLNLYRDTIPHPGYSLLKSWGESKPNGYSVFTSNVDGQFQRSGFAQSAIHEYHGSIHNLQCCEPCFKKIWSADNFKPETDDVSCLLLNDWPRCPNCGHPARPNILMFDDGAWIDGLQRIQANVQSRWLAETYQPVVIEIGAGTAIPSVRRFSEQIVNRHNGHLIRINLRESDVSRPQDIGLEMGALEGLKAIEAAMQMHNT